VRGEDVSQALQFGEVDESVKAYKVLEHRHQPEIESALDSLGGGRHQVLFTPHLVPMQRGILSTIYARTRPGVTLGDLIGSIDGRYAGAPFVRRLEGSPETRWVVGSNNALVSVALDGRSGTAVIITAIDNLIKGAAGQAIQCANLMLGFDETDGLPRTGWMP
jgi:N-acetyl-gamma-glutamyl-phosphate reductase